MGFIPPLGLSPAIFRAYDIRGIVGDSLTPEIVFILGQSIGTETQLKGRKTLVTARDGRLSGPILHKALNQGIQASGCGVIDIGSVPTPLLYFASLQLKTGSGVMLTGSHNPANYNGLKIMIAEETLAEESIYGIYKRIQQGDLFQGNGTYETLNIVEDYLDYITATVSINKPLKVVVDAGNGIGGGIAIPLLKKLGCQVIELFCEVDGNFPNHHPDPSIPENLEDLIATVKKEKADVGLALDGDADRLGVITEEGRIIWPDRQLMLYAEDVLGRNPGSTIIYDVKSSRDLEKIIRAKGGIPLLWKTGHSLVKAKLKETGALLAGEMSGHVFFKERWFGFDDGLYTAARLLEIMGNTQLSLGQLFAKFPENVSTPELKLAISEEKKFPFVKKFIQTAAFPEAKRITLDGLRVEWKDGWGLIRASNTSPNLILRFEAVDEEALHRIQMLFRNALDKQSPGIILPF